MSTIEIILLIVGVIVFAVSFFLPEKKNVAGTVDEQMVEETVKKSVEQEIEAVRGKMEDVIDETITYSMEKTERTLDRMANEKIMAINEYSDTVLENIHKNHDEVMFLHDMLNQKQQALKKAASEAQTIHKDIEDKIDKLKKEAEKNKEVEVEPPKESPKELVKPKKVAVKKAEETETKPITVQFANGTQNAQNSNDKILNLYKEGKSKMAIAKELGLGVGEVKLVIDLFEGM